MKYKNAQDILPDRLLAELQDYISGGGSLRPGQRFEETVGGKFRRAQLL